MKKIFIILSFILCSVFGWSQITPIHTGLITGFPSWIHNSCFQYGSGNDYVGMLTSTSYIISPSMDFTGCSNISLNFKARTYGGINIAENTITVSISTDNGVTWIILGTSCPTTTTLTAMTSFDLSMYIGTQVKIKLSMAGSNADIGVGVDDISITGTCGVLCSSPTISTQPLSYTKCVGDAVTFSVTASCVSGTVSYQWRKAGTNIIGANSSTYSIPSIASTDVGNYDVVVTCVCGANPITTSNLVSLTVNSSPTISGTTSTTVGGNTTLTGSIAPGTWSSGTPTVATINSSGVVTGVSSGTSIITYTVTATGCTATTTVTITAAGGPCSSITPMTLGSTYTGTLLYTSSDWGSYTGCSYTESGDEIVYSYTPTTTGSYILNGTESYGDPDFYIMNTCGCNGTNIYGSCWNNGDISVALTASTTYYFIVDNYSAVNTAQYSIKISGTAGSPVNESCASAINVLPLPVSGTPYATSGTLGITDDCSGTPYFDVFYKITPSCSGDYTFDMGNSNGDTYMNIYQGTCCSGTLIGYDDDSYGSLDPLITVTLTSATTYYIECGSYSSSGMSGSSYNFNVSTTCSGGGCTPPTTQSTIGSYTNNTTGTSLTVNWTRGNGSKVIVVARLSSSTDVSPTNSVSYTASSTFGSGNTTGTGNYIVYNGIGTSVNITGLTSGSSYTFTIYEYNTVGTCYNLPGSASVVTTYSSSVKIEPNMTGALIDGCDCASPTGEGYNEILFFNTGSYSVKLSTSTSNFNIYYGTSTSSMSNYTGSITSNTPYVTSLNMTSSGSC